MTYEKSILSAAVGLLLMSLAGWPASAFADVSCSCVSKDGTGTTISISTTDATSCTNYRPDTLTCTPGTSGPAGTTPPVSSPGSTAFVPLAPIPGLTQNASATSGSIATFLNNLYIWLIGAAVFLAIIMIVWGGIEMATKESVARHSDGMAKIRQALFGLVLVLAPVLVFTIINPSILNLNVNFQALNTSWGNYTPPAPPVNSQTTSVGVGGGIQNNSTYTCGADCSTQIAQCSAQNAGSTGATPTTGCWNPSTKQYSNDTGGTAAPTCTAPAVPAVQCSTVQANAIPF